MSNKAALKAAKAALDEQNYEKAVEQAKSVLSSDPQNYFAQLFLGRAFEKLGSLEDAAKTYRSAAALKPDDSQAWLGLCSVFEAQGSERIDEYREVAVKAAEVFAANQDIHRCQSAIDKLVSISKQRGTRSQHRKALEVLLPGSSVYDALEGRIPSPSNTYTRIAEITEEDESQWISKEIEQRRTRIGARLGQVTLDVKREVFGQSHLEDLYRHVIDWTSDDEIRRQYEEKLFDRAYDTLIVSPLEQKVAKLDQVLTIAEGMVIIHHPFRRAWDLVLESRDLEDIREYDVGVLRAYVEWFPEAGLAMILDCWISSELSPFPSPPSDNQDNSSAPKRIAPEDRLIVFAEALPDVERSPLAHRLVSEYYLYLEEYQGAIDAARAGIKALDEESKKLGLTLQLTKDALNAVLATALVHHQAPRNHAEARRLFENILQRKPKFTPALIGLGLIFEETQDYMEAADFLSRASGEDPNNVRVRVELAWCKAMNGEHALALEELENSLPELEDPDPRTRSLRALTLYRIGMCMWEIDPSKAARKDRSRAYSQFLAAIKANVNFAPAYTSLGVYYADHARDKKRARQCFQKAFELSPAEVEAAKRLASGFADQGDWEIVEVIAKRVIESGQARPTPGSKKKAISWPYSALGVAQINKQEYQQAIVSFLAALRIDPDDYQSYIGLGESYHNSGRYNSAMRTLQSALNPSRYVQPKVTGETWFAKYMLANVHRELGEYDEAIAGLTEVLSTRPSEFGVLVSLVQTYVEHGWRCIETGVFGQAVESAKNAISTALAVVRDAPDAFNLWKGVGDACSIFSWVQSKSAEFPLDQVKTLLETATNPQTYEYLSDVDLVTSDFLEKSDPSAIAAIPLPLVAAILSFKRGISSCSNDIHAQAVAWYNLGWAEHRAYVCGDLSTSRTYLKAAVRCFKRAIELEAGNAEFWNALGVVTTPMNPEIAQHSFVRSLHLNELNAKVWANLGALYLQENDLELAMQAFGRSQSTDPEYAQAWLGQGLIALSTGNGEEALKHFTHAFEISDSAPVIIKRQYATSSFNHLLSASSKSSDLSQLIQPIFGLEQLLIQQPQDMASRHLSALFLERVGNYSAAIDALTTICTALEAEYEASESPSALAKFAMSKSDLARNQLAAKSFSSAIEHAETALDLTADPGDSGDLSGSARSKIRLSSHLTAGLAHFHANDFPASVSMFRAALVESDSDPDVVCSLVQVLWAEGGADKRAVARDQLLEAVEAHPGHVGVTTLLGAIAVHDRDRDTAAAVKDDLLSILTRAGPALGPDEQARVDDVLFAIAESFGDAAPSDAALRAEIQAAVLRDPSNPHPWTQLAHLTGDPAVAQTAFRMASKAVPPHGDLDAEQLARCSVAVGSMRAAQRAVMLAPWDPEVRSTFWDVVNAE